MHDYDKDVVQKLREQCENITVPESLEPEQMIHVLEENNKNKKAGKVRRYYFAGLAAACLVLVCGAAAYEKGYMRARHEPDTETKVNVSKEVETADDYKEVYAYFEQEKKEIEALRKNGEKEMMELATEDAAVSRSAETEGYDVGGGSYSETNIRQEGVDEGDVVKTDGRYVYVIQDNRTAISIVDTQGNGMKEIHSIKMEELWVQEIYLTVPAKRMTVICSKEDEKEVALAKSAYWNSGMTEVITYDISMPESPKELGRVTQSGRYHSSRKVGNCLYLFSDYAVAWDMIEKDKPETFIPIVNDALIAEKDICLPADTQASAYTIVTSVDMERPGEVKDSRAILSQGGEMYVSNNNIYYYEYNFDYNEGTNDEKTTIRRIGYKDGRFEGGAQIVLKGMINDSFSIDEYKDHLRVVVTQGDTNAVYVLDMNMEIKGSIEGLAKDERVYSARLMGDTGYFVTFRETDPLFSVDFSNPEKPEIIGALKIPGFSDYLHPYGDGKLLGIGMNVDEQNLTTDGVKLTMFDISDPSDVKEEATYVLKNVYSTDVSYDYKAALVDADRNMIGFSGYTNGGQNYYIFGYHEEEGFVCKMEEEINGNTSQVPRGVYIDETIYIVQGNVIEAYSLKDYKKVDDIIL